MSKSESGPLKKIPEAGLAKIKTTEERLILFSSLINQLRSIPDGYLYSVEFGITDVTSNQFLENPNALPNMWGEEAPRGIFPSSGILDKKSLVAYLENQLPQNV